MSAGTRKRNGLAAWLLATPPRAGSQWLGRFVFLRLLGLVYFFAFLSLAHQVVSLVGQDGLLPAHAFLERVHANAGSPIEAFLRAPSVFFLAGCSDALLQTLAWVGVALAALCALGIANAPSLAALWVLQLSFTSVGQLWFAFGWESQLAETGFLAIFLCPLLDPRPFPRTPPPRVVFVLLRWLIVRVMLGAGLIKLRGDPAWRDLTALVWHWETQPLPNPLSPWLHAAPRWVQAAGVVVNHVVELVLPLFAFGPTRARRVAGVGFVLFQLALIASGNLSFLNWLTICPALACLDDGVWERLLPRWLVARAREAESAAKPSPVHERVAWALALLVAVLSFAPVANLLSDRQAMNASFEPFRLVNTYGAFGSVTRVRNELVIEGTDADDPASPDATWRAYELPAKPGDPRRRPPIVAPYHYRLDWLLWFAAMAPPEDSPWVLHLVWKLLQGDEKTLRLFAVNPFPGKPPRWVRVELYRYSFAPPGDAAWWRRERLGAWLKPLAADDTELQLFLFERGWIKDERH